MRIIYWISLTISKTLLKLSNETVAIHDPDFDNQIVIYPNPVKDYLYISHDFIQIDSYELFNLLGEIVKNSDLGRINSIDVKDIKEGIYYLKVKTQYGILTSKIVKI